MHLSAQDSTLIAHALFADGTAFQLITWSKDRTLRFWPVDAETMAVSVWFLRVIALHIFIRTPLLSLVLDLQKVGYVPSVALLAGSALPGSTPTPATTMLANVLAGSSPADTGPSTEDKKTPPPPTFSFRNPPPPEALDPSIFNGNVLGLTSPHVPALSAPIGARAILAGVRAGAPVGGARHTGVHDTRRSSDARPPPGLLFSAAVGSTRMSRGTAGGRRVGMDALTWLSNVKEVAGGGGGERSSSGGRGAGSSGGVSDFERGESVAGLGRRRSDSRGRGMEEGQSLQDEYVLCLSSYISRGS
jgi:hypothetical protein